MCLQTFKSILMEHEIGKWYKDINDQSKLSTYRLFKFLYEPELYVRQNMPRSLRSVITQIRAGTLPLNIETGRYTNTARDKDPRVMTLSFEYCICTMYFKRI